MIDKIFIDRAVSIRKEYLDLSKNVKFYETQVTGLTNFLNEILVELKDLQKKVNVGNIKEAEAQRILTDKINKTEIEYNKIKKIIDPINNKMEKLSQDEQELYKQIKVKYPGIDDNLIINEVNEAIKENLSK